VFDLQLHNELSESFAFISECLLAYADRFHAIPGKNRQITVDVVTKKKAGDHVVQKVIFDGSDILWIDDEIAFHRIGPMSGYVELSAGAFEERLSDQMVVPARLLTVTYTFNSSSRSPLLFPRGWTTRKR
jgi:hypothetical protein